MNHQLTRYLAVGIGNTFFSYGLYAIFLYLGLAYQIANLMAMLVGIIFSFITQGNLVFKNATRFTFAKFVSAWLFLYIINISIIALLMSIPMTAYLAGAIATVPITFVSYFILQLLVFVKR